MISGAVIRSPPSSHDAVSQSCMFSPGACVTVYSLFAVCWYGAEEVAETGDQAREDVCVVAAADYSQSQ